MKTKKFFQLESIKTGNRIIYPIAILKIASFKNTFFDLQYEISAFKIIENKKIYYKNLNLNQDELDYVINSFKN